MLRWIDWGLRYVGVQDRALKLCPVSACLRKKNAQEPLNMADILSVKYAPIVRYRKYQEGRFLKEGFYLRVR